MKDQYTLLTGECVNVLQSIEKDSIDACITDPPYGMNMAEWDGDVPGQEVWEQAERVLKPGGFCLAFCSPKLYHRLAMNMEAAGLLIVDQIMWMTTTKMPKLNGLKPCHEPIVVSQKKKSESSTEKNVARWGTGRINVDEARIPWEGEPPKGWVAGGHKRRTFGKGGSTEGSATEKYGTAEANPNGRYPSNVIGSVLPNHQKYFYDPIMEDDEDAYDIYYYSGRVTSKERVNNTHPTPKPIKLMRYLIRLFSPKNGIVLDPFSGSGSTGIAAIEEGRSYLGIDMSEEYTEIASNRFKVLDSRLDKFFQ